MASVAGLGWLYLARMNAGMAAMDQGMAPDSLGLAALAATFVMWVVMMAAMMTPSTLPAISVFTMLAHRRNPRSAPRMTAMFVAGYALAWVAYCVPAALLQFALSRAALLSPMGESTSSAISAAILVGAGLFQFSAAKGACVSKCRTPLGFLMHAWRDGSAGALIVGLRHGGYCVACCWALMAVMFVVGTMNLLWMALLTVLVLAEKVVPTHWHFDRIVGVGLIAWGAARIVAGVT